MKNKYMALKKAGRIMVVDLVKFRLSHLRRRVFAWAKVIQPLKEVKGVRMAMFRLSYDLRGTMIKKQVPEVGDIRVFMHRVRQRLGKRLLAYAWVAEVHLDGTLHYHVIIVYGGGWFGMPDRAYWGLDTLGRRVHFERLWKKGCTNSDFHVRSPYYLGTYVGKDYQKDYTKLPEGFHAWAVFVSDEALKMGLRVESLSSIRRELFEVVRDEGGYTREEAWNEFLWVEGYRKECARERGESWEFIGAFNDLKQVEKWGVTEKSIEGRMFSCAVRGAV